jgi:hypothetical protein
MTTGNLNANAPWEAGRGDGGLVASDDHRQYTPIRLLLQYVFFRAQADAERPRP